MSARVVAAVFAHSQSKGAARLLLLALADEASEEGMVTAYRRSRSHLARKAALNEGTVKRAFATLRDMDEVEVLAVGTGRQMSDYRIILPGLREPTEGVRQDPPGGAGRAPRGGDTRPLDDDRASLTRDNLLSPVLSRGGVESRPSTFDDFWAAYPLKTGKRAARKAWDTAVRRADPAAIVAGARRYADDPNRDPSFTKYPQGWLSADRWEDGPLPPRTDGHRQTPTERTVDTLTELLRGGENGDGRSNRNRDREPERGLPR